MPVTTYTLSGDFSALVGEIATIRATIHTNSTDDAWVNDTDDEIRLGGALLALNTAGEFTVTLPTSAGTGLQYQVTAEYVNADRQRKTWQSGWFALTANADLADKANDSTLRVNTTLGDQLAARIDGYTDHGDVSGTLTVDPATGTHVLNATDALLVTLADETDGRIVTLYVIGGATNVTVDGIADLELTDGAFASFVRIRGAWVLASAGAAGTPATPDTTPPSAVTDLAVTPGSDGVTATATFTAATDAESTVKYRYRLYATGTTAPAWPTSGSQYNLAGSPINLTGLTVGEDYTMDLQAYSAGGSAAADTATFTTPVPAGWNTILADSFTAADGDLTGHVPNVTPNGAAWDLGNEPGGSGTSWKIVGNKIGQLSGDGPGPAANITVPAGSRSGVGAGIDYNFVRQLDSSFPRLGLGFGPGIGIGMNDDGAYIDASNPSVGPLTLTGTTSGLPLSGRVSFRCEGTALSIMINGTVVATGTTAANWNSATRAVVNSASVNLSTFDNFALEVLTP